MFTKKNTKVTMSFKVTKNMLNDFGILHGGELFKMLDSVSGKTSKRFSGTATLTKAVNNFTFLSPTYEGETVEVVGIIDYAGSTSMEVYMRGRIPARDNLLVATGYFTMVAVDDDYKPVKVPELVLESDEDRAFYQNALQRKNIYKSIDMHQEKI